MLWGGRRMNCNRCSDYSCFDCLGIEESEEEEWTVSSVDLKLWPNTSMPGKLWRLLQYKNNVWTVIGTLSRQKCQNLAHHFNSRRVFRCALLINCVTLVRGCFLIKIFSWRPNSLEYFETFLRFFFGDGTISAIDGVTPIDLSASYSSRVSVTVAILITPG